MSDEKKAPVALPTRTAINIEIDRATVRLQKAPPEFKLARAKALNALLKQRAAMRAPVRHESGAEIDGAIHVSESAGHVTREHASEIPPQDSSAAVDSKPTVVEILDAMNERLNLAGERNDD